MEEAPKPKLYGIGTSVYAQRDGQILVLKRAVGAAAGSWYTPGGVLDPGETPEVCAVRELKEETGLSPAGNVELVGVIPMFVYGHDSFLIHYACDCPTGEVVLSHEHSASRWVEPRAYREKYFSEARVRELEAAHAQLGAMARSVQQGFDAYIAWLDRRGA
ncbi:MAG: NUDIX hydrolase [Myxococcales bacterium]|nr:NUDIX hydrolase [Myxococcales bacterium]